MAQQSPSRRVRRESPIEQLHRTLNITISLITPHYSGKEMGVTGRRFDVARLTRD